MSKRTNKLPMYKEERPHRRFLRMVLDWIKIRELPVTNLLVSKPNLIIAVTEYNGNRDLVVFYTQNVGLLGAGGISVYYDVQIMQKRLQNNVMDTFTNWLAQTHLPV